MVMATGILSLGADMLGLPLLANGLFVLNWLFFIVIGLLAALRLFCYPRRTLRDLFDHAVAPGYFTFVAGCAVLAVVATQAVAILAALLSAFAPQPLRMEMNFFALSMWLWGGMLYTWMMALIFYRYTFFHLSPADLAPPYWINMGAMAISTLAGSLLILNTPHAPFLHSMLPFIKGFTVFYWATGTWWIPMLVVLAIWRHGVRRFPFSYDPMYWGAVFPLGMYAASTLRMMQAMELDFLHPLPQVMFGVGLTAWVLLFSGQLRALHRQWRAGGAG